MAYDILAQDGRPIKKDGDAVKAMDITVEKIEQLDDTNKSFVAVGSTEDEDRDKDIIRQDGWKLTNFKKNPMVPWSHNYWGIPVAKSLRTWVDKDSKKLLFKPQFDIDDETSMKIFNKYKNGFLKSFSVGFRGLKFEYRDEHDRWSGGIEFLEQELLEISAVTIPANPNATVSVHGDTDIQNLLQLGYSQKFAETENGLFYPVREMGEFVNPEVKAIEDNEDIQAVHAHMISEMGEKGVVTEDPIIVGYYFDPEWQAEAIKSWIVENNEPTYKHTYYSFKHINKNKDFEIEEIEEEKEIPQFDEPVKLVKDDSDDSDLDDVDIDATDDLDDEPDNSEKTLEEHFKDMNDVLDKRLEAISNGVEVAFGKLLEGLLEIKSLLNEKTVDSDVDIDDNISDDDLDNPDDDKSNSKSDDDIEIDDSLLSPDNDKNNDNDIIELDDDLLLDKGNTKNAVKSVFSKKLKETLKEVRESFKIEV
jgi:HK97 family phage prohead protease